MRRLAAIPEPTAMSVNHESIFTKRQEAFTTGNKARFPTNTDDQGVLVQLTYEAAVEVTTTSNRYTHLILLNIIHNVLPNLVVDAKAPKHFDPVEYQNMLTSIGLQT